MGEGFEGGVQFSAREGEEGYGEEDLVRGVKDFGAGLRVCVCVYGFVTCMCMCIYVVVFKVCVHLYVRVLWRSDVVKQLCLSSISVHVRVHVYVCMWVWYVYVKVYLYVVVYMHV